MGSRRKNMSSMVLGQAPAARALPLARGAREGGLVVVVTGRLTGQTHNPIFYVPNRGVTTLTRSLKR